MVIEIVLILAAIYLFTGLVFATVFVIKGVTLIDESARGSTLGFRIIIIPGAIVLWPVLLKKWIHAKSGDHDEIT